MPKSEIEILKEIDSKLEEIALGFIDNYDKVVSDKIRKKVIDFINNLDNATTLKERLARLKVINSFRNDLNKYLVGELLVDSFDKVLTGYKELVALGNDYFSLLSSSYSKELYKEIYKDSIAYLTESLTGAGIFQNIVNPIVDKLYELSLRGITKVELKKSIAEYFDKMKMNARYLEQITTDSLYQMTSNYQELVAKDLGLKHYYYAGTKMSTTRSFCNARYGKVFTKSEVEAWANINWGGKIPGTSKTSIFVYRGGYNCRHTLRPISETMYNNLNK